MQLFPNFDDFTPKTCPSNTFDLAEQHIVSPEPNWGAVVHSARPLLRIIKIKIKSMRVYDPPGLSNRRGNDLKIKSIILMRVASY